MPTDITERKPDLPKCTLNEQQLDILKVALQLNLMIVINLSLHQLYWTVLRLNNSSTHTDTE